MMAPRFRPLGRNPNKHTKQGMGMLDDAMSRHGYVAPMTAAADGAILDGNARLETAAVRFPGVEPIIVEHDGTRPIVAVRTDIPSADDPRARDIIVTANRVAEVDLAYDIEVLREFVVEGLDLAPFEFDAPMLDELGGTTAGLTDPDDVPELRKTDIVRGDLFQLGQHRLLCGDSTNAEDVARVMDGEKAALMATDPPYGIGYEYASHDDSSSQANADLVVAVFANAPSARVWTPGKMNLARELAAYPDAKVLCWHKKFAAAGNGLGGASTWEPVLVHGVDHADLPNDYLEHMTDRIPGLRDKHPCPKPVSLWIELVRAFSATAEFVYEPFSGSGTTIIACEQSNRRCYAIEIEPAYVQVAIDRWEAFVGKKAVKLP